jgi:hypothetical protein
MPNLNKSDAVLTGSQRFNDAVDAIAGETKDGVDTPGKKRLDQYV